MALSKIGAFDDKVENFDCYVERLEQYFIANGVEAAAKKKAVLLSNVGAKVYGVLRNLVDPAKPADKTFAELKTILTQHYVPERLVIAERFRFNKRDQLSGETVSEYVVALKDLARTCNFGAFLDQALRDRLVCGLTDNACQKDILSKKVETFKDCCDLATAAESANSNLKQFQGPSSVNKVYPTSKRDHGRPKGKGKPKSKQYQQSQDQTPRKLFKCWRCGDVRHKPEACGFKDATCYTCSKVGHTKRMCEAVAKYKRDREKRLHDVKSTEGEETSDDDLGIWSLYSVQKNTGGSPILSEEVQIEGVPLSMEIDTGASVSVASKAFYDEHLTHVPLETSSIKLKDYGGNRIKVLGEVKVNVNYGSPVQEFSLPLTIIETQDNRPALLGRNWLQFLRLNWTELFRVHSLKTSDGKGRCTYSENGEFPSEIKSEFAELFSAKDGIRAPPFDGFTASLTLKEGAKPIFCKARPVPYAMKEAIEKELDQLQGEGKIYPVNYSEWASPTVNIPKSNGRVRICGDYKVSVNRVLEVDQYPLPSVEDCFAQISGAKVFSKLDLAQAYTQLELDKDSQELLTINTHRGLYRYTRLNYGVASAPAIFQKTMDRILSGIPRIVCRLDDVLIAALDDLDHDLILYEILRRLKKHKIKLNVPKSLFKVPSLIFLAHQLDKDGIRPTDDKVAAMVNAPTPGNQSELRSWLGMVNFYGRFLQNLSSELHPLNKLLQKGVSWSWTDECEVALNKTKQALQSAELLIHYDPKLPIKLSCDASPYGVGAVLAHVMPDKSERPIAYASRTLSSSERNYAQIEREALGIIFGVKKFHKYLFARKFTLTTDSKPLTTILGPKSGIPTVAAARMQRWAVILSGYHYDIEYRRSADHCNADALSRLPLQTGASSKLSEETYRISYVEELPLSARDIGKATQKDPVLARVHDFVINGWPSVVKEMFIPYHRRRNELSVENNCVLWGMRVVIPTVLRRRILEELHEEHLGIVKSKSFARGYIWWPRLDSDIESMVQSCQVCSAVQKSPPKAPLHPWQWATRPWQRVHIDFAEKRGKYLLIIYDSYSKWVDALPMKTITAEKTIEKLRVVFAYFGLPEKIVSDNGPQFTSEQFRLFLLNNGIQHHLVPVYHPASNGAAERSVQTVKTALEKKVLDTNVPTNMSLSHKLASFLIMYRSTPHTVTGQSPATLFLKRQIRNRFTLLKPNLEERVTKQQEQQVKNHDKRGVRMREFEPGEVVRVKNFRGSGPEKWLSGTIIERSGLLTYTVEVGGNTRSIHVEHIIGCGSKKQPLADSSLPSVPNSLPNFSEESVTAPEIIVQEAVSPSDSTVEMSPSVCTFSPGGKEKSGSECISTPGTPVEKPTSEIQTRRYPQRERKPRQRLDL